MTDVRQVPVKRETQGYCRKLMGNGIKIFVHFGAKEVFEILAGFLNRHMFRELEHGTSNGEEEREYG